MDLVGLWRRVLVRLDRWFRCVMVGDESDEVGRAISTGKLHMLPCFHTRPIDVVVYHGSDREHWF